MRVGFWRLKRVLDGLGVSPTVTLNARVCETYPQVVQACVDAGWELNAHSYDQVPMHMVDDELATIERSVELIERVWRRRPRAGIEYIGDWVLDDEPVRIDAAEGRQLVALPYNFELHDIVSMNLQHHTSDVLLTRIRDHFECLYAESAERPKIMSIAMHPYLSGVPHRIGWVRRAFEELLVRPDVVTWDGERILDWFLRSSDPRG